MFLFTVQETFWITDRGVVLTPGFGDKPARIGSVIRLIRPDRSVLLTTIRGIHFHLDCPILIGENFKKDDIPIGTEVWLADESKALPEPKTKELLQKLNALKRQDGGRSIFGAYVHRYRLNWSVSEGQLADFERRHAIHLPKDYRHFLQHAGNGGAGPAYGLLRLRDWDSEPKTANPNYLSTPFPHSQAWNMATFDDDLSLDEYDIASVQRDHECYNEQHCVGSLRICHYGYAIHYLLVVKGPETGNI